MPQPSSETLRSLLLCQQDHPCLQTAWQHGTLSRFARGTQKLRAKQILKAFWGCAANLTKCTSFSTNGYQWSKHSVLLPEPNGLKLQLTVELSFHLQRYQCRSLSAESRGTILLRIVLFFLSQSLLRQLSLISIITPSNPSQSIL